MRHSPSGVQTTVVPSIPLTGLPEITQLEVARPQSFRTACSDSVDERMRSRPAMFGQSMREDMEKP